MKHKIAAIALIVVAFAGCTTANTADQQSSSSSASATQPNVSQEGFTVSEITYQGDNQWTYTVSGEVPTPCHRITVDAVVAESYPEQVTIEVSIIEPEPDTICTQVITPVSEHGSFSASERATVKIRVEN